MNQRIRELAKSVQCQRHWTEEDIAKFARLMVRECVGIVAKRKDQAIDDGWNVDEAMSMAEMDLLEHFGVEE